MSLRFVFDSCDHNVESIFGRTLHYTNGIIIQAKSTRDHLSSLNETQGAYHNQVVTVKRKCSFQPTQRDITALYKQPLQEPNTFRRKVNLMVSSHETEIWYFI